MNPNRNQLAYQEAAVRNASAAELVIILHDVLVRDLQSAIAAMDAGDIEARAKALKHAFLVLAQLEAALDPEAAPDVAAKLSRFYAMARSQMMEAQVRQEAATLRQLIGFVADMRQAWAEVSARQKASAPPSPKPEAGRPGQSYEVAVASSSNWKA